MANESARVGDGTAKTLRSSKGPLLFFFFIRFVYSVWGFFKNGAEVFNIHSNSTWASASADGFLETSETSSLGSELIYPAYIQTLERQQWWSSSTFVYPKLDFTRVIKGDILAVTFKDLLGVQVSRVFKAQVIEHGTWSPQGHLPGKLLCWAWQKLTLKFGIAINVDCVFHQSPAVIEELRSPYQPMPYTSCQARWRHVTLQSSCLLGCPRISATTTRMPRGPRLALSRTKPSYPSA